MESVCFLPGILGSELRTPDGRKVWPPNVIEAKTQLEDWKIEALLSEEVLQAPRAVEKVCVKNIYRGLLSAIEDAGFSREGGAKRLDVLPYDWRLDIVDEIAPMIAEKLDRLATEGVERICFVAHSMGGLVARVLLQDPDYEDRKWRNLTNRFISIATPYKGAPLALSRMLGLEGTTGIPASAFAEIRNKARLRAPYQLLPPPETPMIWTINGGAVSTLDLYGAFGSAKGFLEDSLNSVIRMHAILDLPWPANVSAFQFAGTGFTTVTRLASHQGIRRIADDNSGDETVPLSSATATRAPTMILPGEHLDIVNNRKLHRTLRALIGADENAVIFAADDVVAGLAQQELQISVPVLGVVSTNDRISTEVLAVLSLPLEEEASMSLTIEGLDENSEEIDPHLPSVERRISLNRGDKDLTFRLEADLPPGLYRIMAQLPDGTADETTLIVRQSD